MEYQIHQTDKPYREHISSANGPAFYRDTVAAEFNDKPVHKTYLYHPDPSEVDLQSPVAVQNMGGYMTVGDDYAHIAARMAQNGFIFTTHKPRRDISVHDQLHNPEHSKNVFLYTALVGRAVMQATLLHQYRHLGIDSNEVDLTCHSYGGTTGSLLASLSPETRYVLLQDVAGIISGSFMAHAKGLSGIVGDGVETYKSMRDSDQTLTPDLMAQHKDHVVSNPLLAVREGYALVRDPDIAPNVVYARENYGTRFGGIMFKKSAFFPFLLAEACASEKQIFDSVIVVEDARHTEPNTNPDRNTDTQIRMIRELDSSLQAAA